MDKAFQAAHRAGKKTAYLRRATRECVKQELSCEMAFLIRACSAKQLFENIGTILRDHGRVVAGVWEKMMAIDDNRIARIQMAAAKRAQRIPGATPVTIESAVKDVFYTVLVNSMVHVYIAQLINPEDTTFRIDQGIGRSSKETVWFMTAGVMGRLLAPSRTGVVYGHILRYVYAPSVLLNKEARLRAHLQECITTANVAEPGKDKFVLNDIAIQMRRLTMIDLALLDCQVVIQNTPASKEQILIELRSPEKTLHLYRAAAPSKIWAECARLVAEWAESGDKPCKTLYSSAHPPTSMLETTPAAKIIMGSKLPVVFGADDDKHAASEFLLSVGHNKVEKGRGWPASVPGFSQTTMEVCPNSLMMALRNANPPTGRVDAVPEPSKLERLMATALRFHIEEGPLNVMFSRMGDRPAYRINSGIEGKIDQHRQKRDGLSPYEYKIDAKYDDLPADKRALLQTLRVAARHESEVDAGTVADFPKYVKKKKQSTGGRKSKKAKVDTPPEDLGEAMPSEWDGDDVASLLFGDEFGGLLDGVEDGGGWGIGLEDEAAAAVAEAILPMYEPIVSPVAITHSVPPLANPKTVVHSDGITAIEARKHRLPEPQTSGMIDMRTLVAVITRAEGICKAHRGGYFVTGMFVDASVVRGHHLERLATQLRIIFDRDIAVNHAHESAEAAGTMAANVFARMATAEMSYKDQKRFVTAVLQAYPASFVVPVSFKLPAPMGVSTFDEINTPTLEMTRLVKAARQGMYEFLFRVAIPEQNEFEVDSGSGDGVAARLARVCQHAILTGSVGTVGAIQRANVLGGVLGMGVVHPPTLLNARVDTIASTAASTATTVTTIPLDVPFHPIGTSSVVETINMISSPALSILGDIDTVIRYFGGQAKIVMTSGVVSDGVMHDAVHRLLVETEVPAIWYLGGVEPKKPEAWGFAPPTERTELLGRKGELSWIYTCIEHPEGNWLYHTVGEIRMTVRAPDPIRLIKRVFDLDFSAKSGHDTLCAEIVAGTKGILGEEAWTEESCVDYGEALAKAAGMTIIDTTPELVNGAFMAGLRLNQSGAWVTTQ